MELNLDYANMKPGAYVVKGDNVKSLSLTSPDGWPASFLSSGSTNSDLNQLAATVAWVNIALENRRKQIERSPFRWMLNDRELEDHEVPYGLDEKEFSRIDKALMLHNRAYYLKQKGSRGQGKGKTNDLAWLNPGCVTPDTAEYPDIFKGYTRYRYSGGNFRVNGSQVWTINTENLLRFEIPDMNELWSSSSAGSAIRAVAQVLSAVDELANTAIGDDGGMPIYMVVVPAKFKSESEKIGGWFRDLINRRSNMWGAKKTVSVPEGVTVQKLSLSPEELDLVEIEETKYKSILAAFGVPLSNVNPAANFATKESYDTGFALDMAYQLKWIAKVVNRDEAFKSQGYRLVVEPEKLAINLDKEYLRAQMAQLYNAMGESRMNAYLLAGVQLPEDYEEAEEVEIVAGTMGEGVDSEFGANQKGQIFGYHIENGIFSRDEVRATLGFPPAGEDGGNDDLIAAFEVMAAGRRAGLDVDEVLQLVSLPSFQRKPKQVQQRVNEMDLFDEEVDRAKSYYGIGRGKKVKSSKGKTGRPFKSDILSEAEIASIAGEMY